MLLILAVWIESKRAKWKRKPNVFTKNACTTNMLSTTCTGESAFDVSRSKVVEERGCLVAFSVSIYVYK